MKIKLYKAYEHFGTFRCLEACGQIQLASSYKVAVSYQEAVIRKYGQCDYNDKPVHVREALDEACIQIHTVNIFLLKNKDRLIDTIERRFID